MGPIGKKLGLFGRKLAYAAKSTTQLEVFIAWNAVTPSCGTPQPQFLFHVVHNGPMRAPSKKIVPIRIRSWPMRAYAVNNATQVELFTALDAGTPSCGPPTAPIFISCGP